MPHKIVPLGDSAVVVQFGDKIEWKTHLQVQMLSAYLDEHPFPGMVEYIPAFTNVTVFYDCQKTIALGGKALTPYERVAAALAYILNRLTEVNRDKPREVVIPVCYGGEFGPDLDYVASYHHLTPEEVIRIHSEGQYLSYMLGFAPGFAYLGGLSKRIATPRRRTPRLAIPAGTVGIGGEQTGVYPIETPGGWQLIGRTPVRLFRPEQSPPSLIQPGDVVRFKPITREAYEAWEEGELELKRD